MKRVIGRFKREKAARIAAKEKKRLTNTHFSVISQNCIGGVFYHDMGLRFTSPTIDLYFSCPDFIKFVLDLDHYLTQELSVSWGEEYPIGSLDDITIHFMHYETCSEAKEKWDKRKKRIDRDAILILCTDMEGFDEAAYEQWKKIPYPKVLFSAEDRKAPDVVFYPEFKQDGRVSDLIPERKFYKDGVLINTVNSMNV